MSTSDHITPVGCRPIEGCPGYWGCDDGTLWRELKSRPRQGRIGAERRFIEAAGGWCSRVLGSPIKRGYIRVCLSVGDRQVSKLLHDLILTAFVGPKPIGMECCHFPDRDPANNRLENLRWDTPKANSEDRSKHGTQAIGEAISHAKLNKDNVSDMRRLRRERGMKYTEIARIFGVTSTTAVAAIKGKTWKHVPME